MSVIAKHNAGFFSCCSVKLNHIVDYININSKLPTYVDSSVQFAWYKKENRDITYDYFEHYDNINDVDINDVDTNNFIDYNCRQQFIEYSNLDYKNTKPLIKKYFYPSRQIVGFIKDIEDKYRLDYDNICVLFYRGNDKITETKICEYDEYLVYANYVMKKNPNILFLIQSDETEFINFMSENFPNNSFYFKDKIRHMNKCNSTVDIVMKNENFEFSKYYLAITIIMSKCKYVICGSGNCSFWIVLYRGNNNNVFQNLNGSWLFNNELLHNEIDHCDSDWKLIANEGDKIMSFGLYEHIRYGFGNNWLYACNLYKHFEVSNLHFNQDPAVGFKKQLHVCLKCKN